MIRCIAIDDEPMALDIIRTHVNRIDYLHLEGTFLDPFIGITNINSKKIDLVFLDINMPNMSGMSLAKSLRHRPEIIFTTAHSEYAIESYEVEAVDYLLKPFDFSRFLQAAEKAKERIRPQKEKEYFFVNVGTKKERIILSDILYIEGEGNYVNYITSRGKTMVRAGINETLKILPQKKFLQIHRSFIVAVSRIEKIEDNHVHIGNRTISIGAKFRQAFLKAIV